MKGELSFHRRRQDLKPVWIIAILLIRLGRVVRLNTEGKDTLGRMGDNFIERTGILIGKTIENRYFSDTKQQ